MGQDLFDTFARSVHLHDRKYILFLEVINNKRNHLLIAITYCHSFLFFGNFLFGYYWFVAKGLPIWLHLIRRPFTHLWLFILRNCFRHLIILINHIASLFIYGLFRLRQTVLRENWCQCLIIGFRDLFSLDLSYSRWVLLLLVLHHLIPLDLISFIYIWNSKLDGLISLQFAAKYNI